MIYPNIEAERARAGITKEKMAESLKVSTGTIKNWQNGRTEIPASKIIALSMMFNVSTDYLLGRSKTWEKGISEINWLPKTRKGD